MYNRTFEELRSRAVNWWPQDMSTNIVDILPRLLETQDAFLSILNLAKDSPEQIFKIIESANFPINLFVKHLVVLSDYGGEPLGRLGINFSDIFTQDENGNYFFKYVWHLQTHTYIFKHFGKNGKVRLGNKELLIDQKGLATIPEMSDFYYDIIMILLFASTSEQSDQANLSVCEIGNLLGSPKELTTFVKQRYLIVSRIIQGGNANNLGQIAQTKVCEYLSAKLDDSYEIISKCTGTYHTR